METAIFGLIGVVLGALITVAKEWWFQCRKNKKDAEYLSIQIVCMLDRYVAGCAAVVGDDGLYHGQPDRDGYSKIQVSAPKFEPELARVEWKSLPANLMYEVLAFSNNIEVANNMVSAAFEHATAPDYDGGFEERQCQYAELGIAADALAAKLRRNADLPERQTDKWDSVKYMKDERRKLYARREQIAANKFVVGGGK